MLKQYKFIILYTLEKDNDRADALSRKSNYMKIKKIFKYNILRINNNELLSANKHELNIMLRIIKDNKEEYSIVQKKLQILKDKINECIKEYYDKFIRNYLDVSKTLQLLQHSC